MSKFVYVILAAVNNNRVTLGVFSNRELAEDAMQNELEDELKPYGLRLGDCDNFVIEEWEMNTFQSEKTVRTLTSYDNRGDVAKYLVEKGEEGQSSVPLSRFSHLAEKKR